MQKKSRKSMAVIMNMQWLKETPVAIIEENELPSWGDAERLADAVQQMGATFVRYPAIRWAVHSFGKCSSLPKYPELGDRDLFGEVLRTMQARDIKVMAYCHYGVIHCTCAKIHPEWLGVEGDGSPARWAGQVNHFRACMNNDNFIEAMRVAIRELCENYSFAALYLDGPTWYGDICTCQWCKKKYLERYGAELPQSPSFEDGSQQKINLLRDDAAVGIMRDIQQIANPRPLLFNMTLDHLSTHRTGIPEQTNRYACGGNTTEIHRPGSFWHTLQTLRLGEALGGVSLGYLPPGPYETLRNFASEEIRVVNGAYLMHGATPMLCAATTFLNDSTAGTYLSEAAEMHRKYAHVYHRPQPLREIALVYPRYCFEKEPQARHATMEKAFHGTFLALIQAHRHFTTFFDTQITAEKLAEFKVVALPGVTALEKSKLELLMDYVRNGGNVVIGGDFDAPKEFKGAEFKSNRPDAPYHRREYRETAPRFGYSPVPEAYLKMLSPELRRISRLLPVSDAVVGLPELKRYIEYSILEKTEHSELLAELYLPSGGAFGAPMVFPLGTPPGIIRNRFGKGSVISMAADIGAHYALRRLPESRQTIAAIFDLLAGDAWTAKLDAPAGVIMNITQDSSRYYLHLLNYCGSMQDYGCAVEDTIPVNGLVLHLNVKARTLLRLADNKKIVVGGASVPLPQLNSFDTYIIEKIK